MTHLTLPGSAVPLAFGDGRTNAVWYERLQRMVERLNGLQASSIGFDNDASGMDATTVQTALDEMLAPYTIAEGTLSGAAVDITDIPQRFAKLMLRITGMTFDSAGRNPHLQVSTDNGATFDDATASYIFFAWSAGVTTASLLVPLTHTLAADTSNHMLIIEGYQEGLYPMAFGNYNIAGAGQPTWATYFGSTDAVNALRIAASAGSFDGGEYALIGMH